MLTDVYFPRVNGVSTSIQSFVHSLTAMGHQVTLIAPEYDTNYDDSFEIVRIPGRKVPGDPEDRLMSYGKMLKQAQALCGARQFDVIHVQTPFVSHYVGSRLKKEFGLPVVESYHTFFEEYFYCYIKFLPRRLLKAVARRLSKRQCNKLDSIIVPSTAMSEVLSNYGVSAPINIIPTGMSEDESRMGNAIAFRRKHGIGMDRPVMLFVGRVAHEKNIDFLIKVTAHLSRAIPDVLLIIAGEGPAESHLRQLVRRYSLQANVCFLGYMSRDSELLDCYRAADVFVFSSKTETQGLVLLEAMAQATPVVALSIMGTRDILEHCEGAIIAQDSVSDFSAKVRSLLEDRSARAHYSREALRAMDDWHIDVQTQKLIKLYRSLSTSTALQAHSGSDL